MTDLPYTPGTTDAPDVTTASGKTALKRAGISIGAMLLGVYGLGALITYRPDDPSLNVAVNDRAHNLFGGPGAVFADFFMQTLGATSYVALGAIFAAGAIRVARKRITNSVPRERLLAGAGGVALLACAASAAATPAFWPLEVGLGGMIGDGLAGLLTALFSLPGLPAPQVFAGLTAAVGGGISLAWAFSVTRDDMAAAVDSTAEAVGKAGGVMGSVFKALGGKFKRAPQPWETYEQQIPAERAERRVVITRPTQDESARPATASADAAPEDDAQRAAPPARIKRSMPTAQAPQQQQQPQRAAPQRAQASEARAPRPDMQMRSQSDNFDLPSLDLLATPKPRGAQTDGATLQAQAKQLAAVLADYGVQGDIVSARPGPVITLFELEPAPGVKSARVIGLAEDIARSMSAESCRVAVISGRNAIGIELPNPKRETVYLRTLLGSTAFVGAQGALPLALGETIEGEPFAADLAKMPHLLIAGTTGSGKSVGLNAMILSLLYRHTPEECRFIMIDPKMIELSIFEGIPHLLTPVVTDSKKAVVALKWVVREMEERYRRMQKFQVKNIQGFNDRVRAALESGEPLTRTSHAGFNPDSGEPIYETQELPLDMMPHIVVVIDEVASLMLTAGREVEAAVQALAQMARAAGIHVIMATQRPSVDVITGVIRANFPTRLSYKVASKTDSRIIIGEPGAEQLVGQGDCLFMGGAGRIVRVHGPFVQDDEVIRIVEMLRAQGVPQYRSDVTEDPDAVADDGPADLVEVAGGADDEFYDRAVDIVARDRKASTSYLQRKLSLGYNRAAKLIERMEMDGVISRANHAGRREILVPAPNDGD